MTQPAIDVQQRHDLFCAAIDDLRRQFSTGQDDENQDRESWMEELESSNHSQVAAFYADWCRRNPVEAE